jgi:hypothetical protein
LICMLDDEKWFLAWSRFDGLRKNPPRRINEGVVSNYHGILDALEEASGKDLAYFRIPDSEVKRVAVSATRGSYSGRPGTVQYSDEKYCEPSYFAQQIAGVSNFFSTLQAAQRVKSMDAQIDYWSLTDGELEHLAQKYNIPPISRAGAQGEHWYVDRDRIIAELVKRDNALRAGTPQPTSNVINVSGNMVGSNIQQASDHSSAVVDYKSKEPEVRQFLQHVLSSLDQLSLSSAARTQVEIDAKTVEVQMTSPHPKQSIVTESIHSMRNILEGLTGSLLASGLLFEMAKIFS